MKKLLTFLFILTAFTSSAQVYQRDPSYGRSIDRYQVLKALHIPTFSGVPNLDNDVITNTSAIAYDSTGHKFYVYDPSTETWGQVTGGGIVIDPGVDSITYHNNQLCQWVSGVSTCYFLNKFYDSTALNHDSTKILHFNSGNLVDSVLIPTGTIHIIQDGTGETNIVRVEDSTRLHFATLKNTDDITPSKNSDSSVSFNFTHPHYTKDQIDSIAATLTASGITRAELIDTANNKVNVSDTAAMLAPYHGGGVSQSVISDTLKNYANNGSITTDNVVYSTPIALSVANHLLTGAFALKSQSAYTLFGRGSGSGTPSFLSSIDSNWITGLHSEAYYNTKYLGSSLPSQTGNSGKWLTTNGTSASWAFNTGWSTSGNAGTDGGITNFLGTTDSVPLVFRVKNINRLRFNTNGSMDVGNVDGAIDSVRINISGSGIKFIKEGSGTYGGFLTFSSTNNGVFVTKNNSTGYQGLITRDINTQKVYSGGMSSQYEALTLQSNMYPGTDVESMIFSNSYSSQPKRLIIYGGSNGNEPVSIIPGGDGSLVVGASNTGKAASSIFTVVSTTKGMLPPRMTTTQRNAITSPATALQSYDTDLKQPQYYDGASWQAQVGMTFGTAAPSVTPSAVGNLFLDTTNKKLYIATGTSSSSDWNILN